mmetsp:Transcript_25358/g.59170  ORF Transcript_25358/g.59170 Transcript_25358/m.59170 type:complete len:622 (+) Transcript_25358:339-2204(+)
MIPHSLELVVVVEFIIAARRSARLPVKLRDHWRTDLLHLLELLLKVLLLGILVVVEPLVGLLERLLNGVLIVVANLVGHALLRVGQRVLHRVDVVLQLVARLDLLAHLLVLLLELGCLLHHAFDLVLRQPALVVCDRDLLVLAGALVLSAHVEDAVGIDLEAHLDLRHAARRGGDAAQLELAEQVAVLGHRALALKDLDHHGRLVVLVRREDLRLLRRDDRVARDELGHDAADRLNAERERRHVEQQNVLCLLATLSREDAALHRRAVRDRLVGVDALVGLLAVEEVLEQLLHLRDARGAADEHHLIDLRLLELGIVHHLLHGRERLLEEVNAELLEPRARERLREVDAVVQTLNLDAHLVLRRERALGALDLAAELLDRLLVLGRVRAVLALEDLEQVLDDAVVEILAAKVGIAGRRNHLEHAVVDGEQRDIESAAAEVEDENVLLARLLVEAVRDGSGRRLIDDAHHVEAGDGAGILGRLALRVVEVRRHGDHGVLDFLAKELLGRLLHAAEHHRRDLLGGELLHRSRHLDLDDRLAVDRHEVERPQLHVVLNRRIGKAPANQALGIIDGVRRVERRLVLGGIADEALGIGKRDVRRRHAVTLVIRDDLDPAVLVHAHT